MIKIVTVIAMITFALCATIMAPEFFGNNAFLASLITFELLNILAVILTVTLASIANIHMSLNRIIRSASLNRAKGTSAENAVRREINQDGWMLFWLFIGACGVLFLKGAFEKPSVSILSFVHSAGLTILLTSLLVLLDIYQVIYKIVQIEATLPNTSAPAGDEL